MGDVTSGALTNFCYDKMWQLFRSHDNEVGSKFKGPSRNRARTNCIIYVYNVLDDGFAKLGRRDVVNQLKIMAPRQNGTELSRYLATQGWKAHYWNPDVWEPRDRDNEHVVSFKKARDKEVYEDIHLSGMIVGYNKQQKVKIEGPPWYWPFGDVVKVSNEDPDNIAVFQNLKKLKFAVCIARGGTHCFLISYGDVFEVHWDQEGPSLYGRRSFYGFGWNSGIVLTPPDSSFTSQSIAIIRARTK